MPKSPIEKRAPKKVHEGVAEESESPKNARDIALENWERYGRLGVTAKDHFDIGGSPPLLMNRQYGKTQAETMTDADLLNYLNNLVSFLSSGRENLQQNPEDEWAQGDILSAKKDLRQGVAYLRSIGRLPQEFEDFEVQDLPGDPKKQ